MLGCLLAIFTVPYNLIRWVIDNGWKGVAVLVTVLVAILIGYFVIQGAINKAMAPSKPPAATINAAAAPSAKAAPFLVETKSRSYYAVQAVRNKDDTVTMTGYYELISGKWTFTKGVLVLDKTFGNATIKRR